MFLSYLNDEAKELFMDVALNVAALIRRLLRTKRKHWIYTIRNLVLNTGDIRPDRMSMILFRS